ncbi:CpXC domain-containing protein [Defluviimonas sp. WL0075]|uniref:CpXC domain-containing protein n=1 Tax=Albidovulum sediminicola TaxID=2984331 RepID=A0ABT2Z1S6_9RHOB|nr:CpXC domain-containing protein [Defluviimonas sp. WL0075]MCV2864952.1 CpXC domain-containing protein [Defluviimonas sp. WL0075]
MSMFSTLPVACPNCGTENEMDIFQSVNADRRPDLKAAILDGRFQTKPCTSCATEFRPDPDFNYLDSAAGIWVSARPIAALGQWDAEIAKAADDFALAYGDRAGEAAREIGRNLKARLTFGWPAIREKILIADAGLDDVAIETVKLVILQTRSGNILQEGAELRLIDADDARLTFAWVSIGGGETLQSFAAQRELHDAVRDGEDWAETRTGLSGDLFVDIQRNFIVPEPVAG